MASEFSSENLELITGSVINCYCNSIFAWHVVSTETERWQRWSGDSGRLAVTEETHQVGLRNTIIAKSMTCRPSSRRFFRTCMAVARSLSRHQLDNWTNSKTLHLTWYIWHKQTAETTPVLLLSSVTFLAGNYQGLHGFTGQSAC